MATILVADDAPQIRRLLRAILQPGYDVIEAHDGEQALHRAIEHRPALAILDVAMPGLTGLDVCQRFRQDPTLRTTPIIIITANGGPADRGTALAAGANYFVTKPFSPALIVQLVAAALAGHVMPAH